MTIVWKAGPVSRVRFAAQKPRALDTGPAFQDKTLLGRKRREGVATGQHQKVAASNGRRKFNSKDPSGLSLLRAKNGLDNGVHFIVRNPRAVYFTH